MKAEQITKETDKQRTKLFNKYSRKYLRQIKREIRKEKLCGRYKALVHISEPNIDSKILSSLRQFVKEYLSTNGFYIREYQFGELYDVAQSEWYSISWGDAIKFARQADEMQRLVYQNKYGKRE